MPDSNKVRCQYCRDFEPIEPGKSAVATEYPLSDLEASAERGCLRCSILRDVVVGLFGSDIKAQAVKATEILVRFGCIAASETQTPTFQLKGVGKNGISTLPVQMDAFIDLYRVPGKCSFFSR